MAEKMATREAYGKTLAALGGENSNIVVLDADLSKSTKTADFAKVYPERFFNMGIAESNLMGTAAGMAAVGKVPFASTFAIFATGRAFEQVRNSIAYPALNVKIAATHAGITVGEDGGSHQTVEDIALMRVLPNMTVMVPCDGVSTEALIREAARIDGPVYIRLGRPSVTPVYNEKSDFAVGKANVLKDGADVTLAACGIMVQKALQAAEMLDGENIKARVIDFHTIKPLDKNTLISAARETGAIITIEEHSIIGGLGGAIAEICMEECPVLLKRIGIGDRFGQSGKPDELLEEYGLTADAIADAARDIIKRKK